MKLPDLEPSLVRKYMYEYVLMGLAGCVVYLFLALRSSDQFYKNELLQQRSDLIRTLEGNSSAIKEFLDFQKRHYLKTEFGK